MAENADNRSFSPLQHTLVPAKSNPNAGKILSFEGTSTNLERSTRVVSDRVIFVDNIADSLSKQEFCEIVKEYATRGALVDIKFLTRTKGSSFAFVEFESEDDGRDAISALNTKDYTTNSGKVLELRASKAENPTETVSNKNLYVKGLPRHWSNDDLKRRFRAYGSISHCRTLKRPGSSNENTGVGFVHFFNALDAAKAIEEVDCQQADLNDPNSKILEVKFARAKKPRTRRSEKRGGRKPRGLDIGGPIPNWNFARSRGGAPGGRGRGLRGRGTYGGMYGPGPQPDAMYPPNEEVWAKMVEMMQSLSMANWPNPYNVYGSNYQNYYPRNNDGSNNANF